MRFDEFCQVTDIIEVNQFATFSIRQNRDLSKMIPVKASYLKSFRLNRMLFISKIEGTSIALPVFKHKFK